MRRRRRRARGVWLPNTGQQYDTGENDIAASADSYVDFNSTLSFGAGRKSVAEFALFQDQTAAAENAASAYGAYFGQNLNELIEWGYLLRRILGKLYISVWHSLGVQDQVTDEHNSALLVIAGIMVRRVDPEDPIQSLQSIDGAAPGQLANIRDPWMWRRAWMLRNCAISANETAGLNTSYTATGRVVQNMAYPETTAEYGSVADGPNVDVKSRRRVGPEERVFLNVEWRMPEGNDGPPDEGWESRITFDYRGFATLKSNAGNRRNSSR